MEKVAFYSAVDFVLDASGDNVSFVNPPIKKR